MIAKVRKSLAKILVTLASISLLTTVGAIVEVISARPSLGAETIRFYIDGPLTVSVSLESLEIFAETGEITGDLKLFTLFLDDQIMGQLRQGLQQPLPLDVVQTYKLSYSPLGRDAISEIGKIVRFTPNRNGFYGLRAALIGAAANAEEEGWTILDAIAQFPTKTIEVDVQDLLQLKKFLAIYVDYNRAAVNAIANKSQIEAESQSDLDLVENTLKA